MSDTIDDGGPAFGHGNYEQGGDPGMTLRDYFAGQALPQSVEDYTRSDHRKNPLLPHAAPPIGTREDIIARQAYRYADAMIAARGDLS